MRDTVHQFVNFKKKKEKRKKNCSGETILKLRIDEESTIIARLVELIDR